MLDAKALAEILDKLKKIHPDAVYIGMDDIGDAIIVTPSGEMMTASEFNSPTRDLLMRIEDVFYSY